MRFSLKSLLLLPLSLTPMCLSYLLLDASSGLQVLQFLAIPLAIYAAVFSLALSTGDSKNVAVFRYFGHVGIGIMAGFTFVLLAITPWLVRGYFTDFTKVSEMFGALAQFGIIGMVIGAACGVLVGRAISFRTKSE